MKTKTLSIFAVVLWVIGLTTSLFELSQPEVNWRAVFVGFAIWSFGQAILGFILVFNAKRIIAWQIKAYSPYSRSMFRRMGYDEFQLQKNSLLFPWSPKARRYGEVLIKIIGGMIAYASTIWFILSVLALLGVAFQGIF